jgi:hypothetical protein
MRGVVVRMLGVLSVCCLATAPLTAQDSIRAEQAPVTAGELLVPAETERIVCSVATDDEIFEIRRRGEGWYRTTEGVFAMTYRVQLTASKRTITVGLDQSRRPRFLMAVWTVDREAGGGMESVVIRFLPNGEVRDGRRTRKPARSGAAAGDHEAQRTDFLPEDGILAYTLARELGFRCERGILEPLPEGVIWTRIPPP